MKNNYQTLYSAKEKLFRDATEEAPFVSLVQKGNSSGEDEEGLYTRCSAATKRQAETLQTKQPMKTSLHGC